MFKNKVFIFSIGYLMIIIYALASIFLANNSERVLFKNSDSLNSFLISQSFDIQLSILSMTISFISILFVMFYLTYLYKKEKCND